jgi:RHS repeat-associated protein
MLDSVALVHMNGRVYDPFLGRFLSPDPIIQSLGATESINPYAYAWNDPLKYVDPSGHSLLGDLIGVLVGIIVAIALPELLPGYFSALSVPTLAVAGFVGGFVGAYVSTGSLSAALLAGLIAGITAAAFAEIGSYVAHMQVGSEWERSAFSVLAHAAVGCGSSTLSGGNCGRGALAAGISEAAKANQGGLLGPPPKALANWGTFKGAAEAGLLGGVAAKITGGKFDDGFTVSAAGYLFNSAADSARAQGANASGADSPGFWATAWGAIKAIGSNIGNWFSGLAAGFGAESGAVGEAASRGASVAVDAGVAVLDAQVADGGLNVLVKANFDLCVSYSTCDFESWPTIAGYLEATPPNVVAINGYFKQQNWTVLSPAQILEMKQKNGN